MSSVRTGQNDQTIMAKLVELCSFLGIRPLPGETPSAFGSRALVALDRRIEFLDDELRFQIVVTIHQGAT
jgi:hypothetical protein